MSFMSFASEMLGNLFKPPATSQYPFKPRKVYEADRGKVINDINNCIFCGMCMRNCPSDAITVDRMPAPGRLIALPACSAKSA